MSIFLMGNGDWRLEAGGWRLEAGGWRLGNGDWGMGNGESGMGSREPTADAGTSCPLSAYRFPNLLTIFSNDLNNQLANRESRIGKLTADS